MAEERGERVGKKGVGGQVHKKRRRKRIEGGVWEEEWLPRAPLKEGISGITQEN